MCFNSHPFNFSCDVYFLEVQENPTLFKHIFKWSARSLSMTECAVACLYMRRVCACVW